MARIRTIKPDFFTSEKIASLPVTARLTFIGLWTYVDDNGVGLDNARLVMAAVWPLEDDPTQTLKQVAEDLSVLTDRGLIQRYTAGGRKLIYIPGWDEHQKVQHPAKPRHERPSTSGNIDPPEGSGEPHEDPMSPPETFTPEQGTGNREQGSKTSEPAAPDPDANDDEPTTQPATRLDVERVCNHLVARVVANGSKRPVVTRKWRDAARRMIDVDGRTPEQIIRCIDWCQDHEFWRSTILSMPKLRERYDQLRLQANRGPAARGQPLPAALPASNAPTKIPDEERCPKHRGYRKTHCAMCRAEHLAGTA
jgi:hypothetical protein